MKQHLESEIVLVYATAKHAAAIAEAIAPDNTPTPKGVEISTLREGRRVITSIKCALGLRTFKSTIDDILCSVAVAEKSLKAANDASQS